MCERLIVSFRCYRCSNRLPTNRPLTRDNGTRLLNDDFENFVTRQVCPIVTAASVISDYYSHLLEVTEYD